tara:strand:- start:2147 stop:2359 length:213 start_codon:yes stop_codon:yes gene_type:complete
MIEKKDITLERAVLIGVITKDQNEEKSKEYLDELEFLTFTAGGYAVKRFTAVMQLNVLPKKWTCQILKPL